MTLDLGQVVAVLTLFAVNSTAYSRASCEMQTKGSYPAQVDISWCERTWKTLPHINYFHLRLARQYVLLQALRIPALRPLNVFGDARWILQSCEGSVTSLLEPRSTARVHNIDCLRCVQSRQHGARRAEKV